MSDFKREAQFRNTPTRIKRIENFVVNVKFFSVNERPEVSLSFTEAVVVNKLTTNTIDNAISELLHNHDEAAVLHMQTRLTKVMRNALITCNAVFDDEQEDVEVFAADDQAVRMSDEEIEIIDSNWS